MLVGTNLDSGSWSKTAGIEGREKIGAVEIFEECKKDAVDTLSSGKE